MAIGWRGPRQWWAREEISCEKEIRLPGWLPAELYICCRMQLCTTATNFSPLFFSDSEQTQKPEAGGRAAAEER
jgi:hypothetical protein